MKKKSEAEKIFDELSKKEGFQIDLVLGRRNHLSAKEITTLRINEKGRITVPVATSEGKLSLSEFEFYKVGFDKKKLYILFVKEEDEKTKKFFRYKNIPKKTCYLELGPQLRARKATLKTLDLPISLKETKKGLLVLDVSLLFPATK